MKTFHSLLLEALGKDDYFAAVAIIRNRDKWLLGLAKTNDDRNGKWCFVGGGVKNGEDPIDAAVREAKEESGIRCRPISGILHDKDAPGVAFVVCRYSGSKSSSTPKPNHEFNAMDWFTTKDMRSLKLYKNVKRLIDKAKRY